MPINIFVLSTDPVEAAQMQCDRHVVKMCLETAQILSTVLLRSGATDVTPLYRETHPKHPCVQWAFYAPHYSWLCLHGRALCEEYTYRYGKIHASAAVIAACTQRALSPPLTYRFEQCMPDEYKVWGDPVTAYRRYYHSKRAFTKWDKARPAPDWWLGPKYTQLPQSTLEYSITPSDNIPF